MIKLQHAYLIIFQKISPHGTIFHGQLKFNPPSSMSEYNLNGRLKFKDLARCYDLSKNSVSSRQGKDENTENGNKSEYLEICSNWFPIIFESKTTFPSSWTNQYVTAYSYPTHPLSFLFPSIWPGWIQNSKKFLLIWIQPGHTSHPTGPSDLETPFLYPTRCHTNPFLQFPILWTSWIQNNKITHLVSIQLI